MILNLVDGRLGLRHYPTILHSDIRISHRITLWQTKNTTKSSQVLYRVALVKIVELSDEVLY